MYPSADLQSQDGAARPAEPFAGQSSDAAVPPSSAALPSEITGQLSALLEEVEACSQALAAAQRS